MISKYNGILPITQGCYLAPNASIVGDVEIQPGSSVWYNTVIRGDEAPIRVGSNTNIQDNCTLHCSVGIPMSIGNGVTVGHNAILHGCTIGNNVLIGMGAIVLDGAVIGDDSIIGAGALITENKVIEPGTIAYGFPAKPMGILTENDRANNRQNALDYVRMASELFGE